MPEDDTPRPIRVALSNDYEIALLGLAQMLARHPEQVQVVALTTQVAIAHEPDVILFDTFGRVPDVDGKLRKVIEENDALVVVYSWEDYPEEAARRAGAAGYLSKRLGAGELVAAIVALHDGQDPEPGAGATDDASRTMTWPGQAAGLSQRESEMLTFIVRGLTNEEIGRRSFLSINTVKTYVRTAYAKIGARNRAEAVAWGIRHGFESTDETGL